LLVRLRLIFRRDKDEITLELENVVETDVLVIGGGVAGCFAAIKAREQGLEVAIVDKAYSGKSGSSIAAGGCFMVLNPEWGHDFDASIHQKSTSHSWYRGVRIDKILML
jgi:succinate dehydrogenase/fumarate reductase flavoprotein subunit